MSNDNGTSANTDPLTIFMPSGRRSRVSEGTTLLDAARSMGVEIESICGGKLTCGKCKVKVEDGNFQKHGITSASANVSEKSDEEQALLDRMNSGDYRLSCVACVSGDVLVTVPEESRAKKQVIRKSATERAIDVNPAIRQVYIEVDKPALGEHRGDWGRVQAALKEQWDMDVTEIDIHTLRKLQPILRKGKWTATATVWHEKELIAIDPGYVDATYGLAVDIGSTTVAAYLCDLRTGEIKATESMMNPQVTYGEDLMSRVSYAMMNDDGLDKMHDSIISTLNKVASRAAKEAGIRVSQIHDAVFVGNTTMVHILMGVSPVELGGAPFALANRDAMDVKARDMGLNLHKAAYVHVLPSEAGHVGADNVGVLVAEELDKQDDKVLIVDIGTNGEIALGNIDTMFSASSPTGPAFEGAQIAYGMRAAPGAIERVRIDPVTKEPTFKVIGEDRFSNEWDLSTEAALDAQTNQLAAGICGSGIIEAIAELFLAGIINGSGQFRKDTGSDRVRFGEKTGMYVLATADQTTTGAEILVTQDDVRAIQLGKAALYSGAKLLMNHAGIETVDRVLLAGAFGSYIDPKYAMVLGLIPDCALDKVYAVGNAAGDGARITLLDKTKRPYAQELAHTIRYIETAVDPSFQDIFVSAIHIPNKIDPYPHLADILPQQTEEADTDESAGRGGRRRKRRRSTTS